MKIQFSKPGSIALNTHQLIDSMDGQTFKYNEAHDIPLLVDEPQDSKYKYQHYSIASEIGTGSPSEIIITAVTRDIREQTKLLDGLKIGDIVLRLICYDESVRGFNPHIDPNYFTVSVCSFDGGETLSDSMNKLGGYIYFGSHAPTVDSSLVPTVHSFNPQGKRFSIVVFYNLHFSHKLNPKQTVGDYLQEKYYKKVF